MPDGADIAFFGSSLVSSWWNGAATYYRGVIRGLSALGHHVTFYEPVAYQRQEHRDIADPDWATVVIYRAEDERQVRSTVARAAGADVVVKTSGVGVHDHVLEDAVLGLGDAAMTVYWDVDAPATLGRMEADADDPLRRLLSGFDHVLSFGGGQPVVDRFLALGAARCDLVYNALDPATHHPAAGRPAYAADLSLLANRLPDREERMDELFLRAASLLPGRSFLLGGNGWEGKALPANVRTVGHVGTADHNAFNCSALAVLNVTREAMAANGWSPPTRVFEAAGAGACLLTDDWAGIGDFLEPGAEVLVAADGAEVAALVDGLDGLRAAEIGDAARKRVLHEHTYGARAEQVDALLRSSPARRG